MKAFRAYCLTDVKGKPPLYFNVKVYPTKKGMQAGLRRADLSTKCDALCSDWVHKKWDGMRFMTQGDIGCLYFHHDSMRVGVICHEAFHAAIAWHQFTTDSMKLKLERKKDGAVGDHEEDVAWVAGNIARQVVSGYWKNRR